MSAAIGYVRVSTSEQGRSGLGLGAQRQATHTFAAHEGLSIKSWYEYIQTGAGAYAFSLLDRDRHAERRYGIHAAVARIALLTIKKVAGPCCLHVVVRTKHQSKMESRASTISARL
jgi:hypothetical protein